MRIPLVLVCLVTAAFGWLSAARPAAANPHPLIVVDTPLRPLAQPPAAEVTAYSCIATIACDGESCAIHTTQRYHLSLSPESASTTLRVGLPVQDADHPAALTKITLADEQGKVLPLAPSDAEHHAVWEIPLEHGARRVLELSYAHPSTADPFIIWSWDVGALSAWGAVPAVHGEFVLPIPAHDDALVRVDPHRANLLGPRLWWDYEMTEEYPPHHVVTIAPPVWERLQAARARNAHHEVAAILTDLQAAADSESIPGVDYAGEAIAEFLAALEEDPGDVSARLDLAAAYRSRAEEAPERRLNYLLLAARELSVALEDVGDMGPSARDIAGALGRTYLDAAETASTEGDPAGALEYLGLAREVAGAELAEELAHADELTLRWALKLAEQGRVDGALAQLEGLIAPTLHEGLLHFAPPLVGVRTEVSLHPSARTVRYHLQTYAPAEERVRERLDDIARRLGEVPCCAVDVRDSAAALLLTVRVPTGDPAALEGCRADVHAALAGEQDLVAAIVAVPWAEGPSTFARESELWRERWRYAERVDTTALVERWRSESEYAGWRLVELHSATPPDTRAQLEQQLALAVMREQRQVWEALPAASQWAYDVAFTAGEGPAATWLVAWGQSRALVLDRSIPDWVRIRMAALVVVAFLALPLIVRRLWRALRTR